MIKYMIVDDEPLAHELIEEFCGMLPHLKLGKNCYSAMEAMEFLNNSGSVDLMFLDLNMPKLKGFEFLRTLSNPPKVIVTTAYKEFALEGYELNVVDYLLKPFSFERLVQAVNKALATNIATPPTLGSQKQDHKSRLFIKGDKKYHQVFSHEIQFIEAYGNYSKIYLMDQLIISHEKISHFETILSENDFMRVHKSFIVALDKIKTIEGNRINIGKHEVPIGQTYKSVLSKLYNT